MTIAQSMDELKKTDKQSVEPVKGDSLLDCLLSASKLEGRSTTAAAATSGLPLDDGDLTADLFVRAANRIGLAALLVKRTLSEIRPEVLPSILLNGDKGLVLTDINHDLGYAVLFTSNETYEQISLKDLEEIYNGHLFFIRPVQEFDSRSPRIHKDTSQHWFWGVIKSSSKIYRDVLIASFLINVFVLAQPLFVMNVYDRVVPNNAIETLWALSIGVILVYVFDVILKGLRSYFVEMAAKRSDVILSAQLFEKVLNLKTKSRPVSVGAFANRIHEFDSIRSFITSSTILTLIDLPFAVLFLVVIYYLGGPIVLVPLSILPIAIIYGLIIQKRLKPSIEKVMRGSARKNATLIESLIGVDTIKSLGAESKTQRAWEQSVGYVSQWSLKTRATSNTVLQFVQFLQQIGMVCVVIVGVYLIAQGELTLGGLIACVILNGRVLAPLGQVAGLLSGYDYASATLKSLTEIMSLPTEREADKHFLHRPVLNGNLTFKDVSFKYTEESSLALERININIKAGEKVGIIGRTGSGKSTLAKMLLGLNEADSGAVMVDGFDLQQVDPADLRKNIGYASQDITLFFGSIRENIALGVSAPEDVDVISAAEKAGISEFINSHPLGYEMPVGERGATLSGGQRQAVGLARVFIRNPQIYVLDEPTSAMDQGSEAQICQQLKISAKDKTLILVTHRSSMLDLVDRLIVLDRGKVVADGPKEKVLAALKSGNIRGGQK